MSPPVTPLAYEVCTNERGLGNAMRASAKAVDSGCWCSLARTAGMTVYKQICLISASQNS